MLSREEKLILQELPQVKEELDKTIQFLEGLSNLKETISEDRYKQLENKYSTGISELKAKKERITNQCEMKKDELKIEKASLQNRRQEIANNLQEINRLKEQNAMSSEEYKKESKPQKALLGELDKEIAQIDKDIETINFYQNSKGNDSKSKNKLQGVKSSGSGKGFFAKLNWMSITAIAVIILVLIALIINIGVGKKISKGFDQELTGYIGDLKDQGAVAGLKVKLTYSDISVNPLLGTAKISDIIFSVSTDGSNYYRDKEEIFESKCSSLKVKVKLKDVIKYMKDKDNPEITYVKISFSDLHINSLEEEYEIDVEEFILAVEGDLRIKDNDFKEILEDDPIITSAKINFSELHVNFGDERNKIDVEEFIYAFKGDLNSNLFEGNFDDLSSSKQNLKIELNGGSMNLSEDQDEISNTIFGLDTNTEQIKSLSINANLKNKQITIKGKLETFGWKMDADVNIQLDIDDPEASEFKNTKIKFYDLSDEIVDIVPEIEKLTDQELLNKKDEIILEISGEVDDPDMNWEASK